MVPQDIYILILRTFDCYIIRQKQQAIVSVCVCVSGVFQDMINLRIEDKEIILDYLGGSQMRLYMLYKREGDVFLVHRGQLDVKM